MPSSVHLMGAPASPKLCQANENLRKASAYFAQAALAQKSGTHANDDLLH